MSTILITNHNECIHNIVNQHLPKGPVANYGNTGYISKYRPQVIHEERKVKECHKTFGFASVPLPKPCNYLRKNCRIEPPRPIIKEPRCLLKCRKPCLPACPVVKKEGTGDPTKEWEEGWKKGKGKRYPCPPKEIECLQENRANETRKKEKGPKPSDKNFRVHNILKAVRSVPRQPQPKFVDTKKGDTQHLKPSGLLPCYIHKKNYGQIPCYLTKQIHHPCVADGQMLAESAAPSGSKAKSVPDAERRQILEGLKNNWNEIQKAYQMLPILTDTLHKRLRKERLEKELRQLEHDIRTIERHKYIYVVDENC